MKRLNPSLLALLLLLCAVPALAKVTSVPVDELKPTREHRQAALIILKVIDKYHYREQSLDDEMSSRILDKYLESLDGNKSFFSAGDVVRFDAYRQRLDDALRFADLDPAFDIFKIYRQRVDERVAYGLSLLEREFDFTVDEEYRFDRSEADWAADRAALDELWRKRVKNDVLALRLAGKPAEEITRTLRTRYESLRRRVHQLGPNDVFQTFINCYTVSLEPHTAYMSPRAAENFDISMRLSLEGIGAVLRTDDEYTTVQRVVTGGPADASGQVRAGDRIVGVGEGEKGEIEDVIGWRLQDVVDRIRGPKGTTVRLQILPEEAGPDDTPTLVVLKRNKIKLEDQAAKKRVIEGLDGMGPLRIGVIELPAFYRDFKGSSRGDQDFRSTTRDVRRLLQELKSEGVDGVVVDLRNNGGGSLVEATELTGLFIRTGPVVQVRGSDGDLEVEKDSDPEVVYEGPLAVLVDRNSASASEIFAGAIQDYRRGIIIGEPTFGKGTVQTLVDLGRFVPGGDDDLGRLRLTMAQFFRVNGGSTQFKGVIPDIEYPTAVKDEEHGERGLDNALPWASISPVRFDTGDLGALDAYRLRHVDRLSTDPGFRYLLEEQDLVSSLRGEHTISLMESRRKASRDERQQRRLAIKNRYRAAIGEAPLTDADVDDGEETEAGEDEDGDGIGAIELNEAARVLADYVGGQRRAAMVQ